MIYSILIYGSESCVAEWSADEENEVMGRHTGLREELGSADRLGPVLRLAPEGTKTVRRYKERRYITDGPFAETKEQLMGLYVVDCATLEQAIAVTDRLQFDTGVFEIRPTVWLDAGGLAPLRPPPK